MALLASGQSNKEMARTLGISPNTVKTHVARVYEKLEVQKRVQAIEKARWLALIPYVTGEGRGRSAEITRSGDIRGRPRAALCQRPQSHNGESPP